MERQHVKLNRPRYMISCPNSQRHCARVKRPTPTCLTPPASGVLAELFVTKGQYVSEGGSLMRLEGYRNVWIEADVYPSKAGLIAKGQQVKVRAGAYLLCSGYVLKKGKIPAGKHNHLHPEDFEVDEIHRFEGMNSLDDNSVPHAISFFCGMQEILVDAYGVHAENITEAM